MPRDWDCGQPESGETELVDYSQAKRIMEEKSRKWEQEAENRVRQLIREELNAALAGLRDVRQERPTAENVHLLNTPGVLSGTRIGPGEEGGYRVGPGNGSVHPGSGEGEHRTRDRGEQTQNSVADTPAGDIQDPAGAFVVVDMDFLIAALLMMTQHTAFGATECGYAAQQALFRLCDRMDAKYGQAWRTWWPSAKR